MAKPKTLHAYILLDRSGSMATGARWETSISGINTYVETLKKEGVDAVVTVAAFDTVGPMTGFAAPLGGTTHMTLQWPNPKMDVNFLRDAVALSDWKDVGIEEVKPRGGTPLYDATAVLLNKVDAVAPKKAVIMIVTDGEENNSTTYNLTSIKDRIATCKGRGWEVVFLGAEFNADNTARSFGLGSDKVINTTLRNMAPSMDFYAKSSSEYTTFGSAFSTEAVKASMAVDDV